MGVSFLFGLNTIGYKCVVDQLKGIIHPEDKVSIIPWALSPHDKNPHVIEDYYPRKSERYEREVSYLQEFGIQDKNIIILDFYIESSEEICDKISTSDVVILCGGDTELLVDQLHRTKADKALSGFQRTIIGGSAGATSQFVNYFITAEQSYFHVLQECKGIGLIDSDFMIDVHTNQYTIEKSEEESKNYFAQLEDMSKRYMCKILAIYDYGAIIYDRESKQYKAYGTVIEVNACT